MIDQETIDKVEQMSEVHHYLVIEECGGFIWYMNHEMSHGRIPEDPDIIKDIDDMRELQEYLISKLGKFGVNPESAKYSKHISDYWKWYEHWHKWHKETLTEDEWRIVSNKLSKDEDISEYLPKKKWNETEFML